MTKGTKATRVGTATTRVRSPSPSPPSKRKKSSVGEGKEAKHRHHHHHRRSPHKDASEELRALYKQAMDIQQNLPVSEQKIMALRDIKHRVNRTLSPHMLIEMGQKAAAPPTTFDPPVSSSPLKPQKKYTPYPSIRNPAFPHVISRKKEFRQGSAPPVDPSSDVQQLWNERCKSNEFVLSPNQHLLKNIISPHTPYNGMMLFHGVGVGKTCAAVTIAEQFPERQVLVITPLNRVEFLNHVFDRKKLRLGPSGLLDVPYASNQCTGSTYINRLSEAELGSLSAVDGHITRLINAKYTVLTFHAFAKEVKDTMTGPDGIRRLHNRFRNHVIIVDEAHRLRAADHDRSEQAGMEPAEDDALHTADLGGPYGSDASSSNNSMSSETNEAMVANDANSNNVALRQGESGDVQLKLHKPVTDALRKVLEYSEGIKLLLLTATPMYNDTNDILDLIDMLLLNDKRKPLKKQDVFGKKNELTEAGAKRLLEATRGYISYMRGDDPFAFPARFTPAVNADPSVIIPKHSSYSSSSAPSSDLPIRDVAGEVIPPAERLQQAVLLGSTMGEYQAAVYTAIESMSMAIPPSPSPSVGASHMLRGHTSGAKIDARANGTKRNGTRANSKKIGIDEYGDEDDNDGSSELFDAWMDENDDEEEEQGGERDGIWSLREGEEGSNKRQQPSEKRHRRHQLSFGISNIVYPLDAGPPQIPDSAPDGIANRNGNDDNEIDLSVYNSQRGFARCFTRVTGGKGLRVRYALKAGVKEGKRGGSGDSVYPFLAPEHIGKYAPKLKAVVDRILTSEGVVFVYSRFLYSGLFPLAIALEHVGFSRYGGSPNLLQSDNLPASAAFPSPGQRKVGSYIALTARKDDFSTNFMQEIAAATSIENVNGDVVKVILASDKAAEGIDLRYIREVHVLEPWYHFNRIEQVVGRAVRTCSHADLPLEKRNVTVYLHAGLPGRQQRPKRLTEGQRQGQGLEDRETVDLWAYRIAEIKQRRIAGVERLLMNNAVDCAANIHALYYDPKRLDMRVRMITAQGKVLPAYPLGDHPPQNPLHPSRRVPPSCVATIDGGERTEDDSTYNPRLHASGIESCKNVIMRMFADGKHSKVAFTFDELSRECFREYPRTASQDAVIMAIQTLLDERTPVTDLSGRDGYVIYASDKYIFQPRGAFDEKEPLHRRVASSSSRMLKDSRKGDVVTFAPSGSRSLMRQRSNDNLSRTGKSILRKVDFAVQELARQIYPSAADDSTPNRDQLIDYVVDRLDQTSLLRLIRLVVVLETLQIKGTDAGLDSGSGSTRSQVGARDVMRSLKHGHVIIASTSGGVILYDYFSHAYLRVVRAQADNAEGRKQDDIDYKAADEEGERIVGGKVSREKAVPKKKKKKEETEQDAAAGKAEKLSNEDDRIRAAVSEFHIDGVRGAFLQRAKNEDSGEAEVDRFKRSFEELAAYALPPSSPESAATTSALTTASTTMKVMGSSKGSSGCTCHQTSSVKVDTLAKNISDIEGLRGAAARKVLGSLDKRALCARYEVALRKHQSHRFARPSVSARLFKAQQGKLRQKNIYSAH